jgi:hypothetical protein
MVLKGAIFLLALGLFVFMGMALLNVEAQRTQIAILNEQMAKLQPGPGASPAAAGPAAGTAGRVITFDAAPPALFDGASASTPQAMPAPGSPAGEIQLAVVTLTGVEGANGVMVPLSAPAVLIQKGVSQEVRGGCSVDSPPTGAWVLSLQGASLQVASHDCAGARGGLRPHMKITVFQ